MNEQLSMLREYISVDILESDKAAVEIIRILKLFTRWCRLDDEDEPHSQNQKILYNSGDNAYIFASQPMHSLKYLIAILYKLINHYDIVYPRLTYI